MHLTAAASWIGVGECLEEAVEASGRASRAVGLVPWATPREADRDRADRSGHVPRERVASPASKVYLKLHRP